MRLLRFVRCAERAVLHTVCTDHVFVLSACSCEGGDIM